MTNYITIGYGIQLHYHVQTVIQACALWEFVDSDLAEQDSSLVKSLHMFCQIHNYRGV